MENKEVLPMVTLLTSVIGLLAKGKAAKAIAGGIGAAILPGLSAGFNQGVGSSFEELGLALGQMVGAFVVGYLVTWIAPKNKDA